MDTCDWQPFIIARWSEAPSIEAAGQMIEEVTKPRRMDGESIYDGNRLAQPDEGPTSTPATASRRRFTWRMFFAVVCRFAHGTEIDMHDVVLKADRDYRFDSAKHFQRALCFTHPAE